jgi:hypothetical protein
MTHKDTCKDSDILGHVMTHKDTSKDSADVPGFHQYTRTHKDTYKDTSGHIRTVRTCAPGFHPAASPSAQESEERKLHGKIDLNPWRREKLMPMGL